MTTPPEHAADAADPGAELIPAVPVAVGHDVNVQGQAADYGGWAVYKLAGTEQPQPVLPFDGNRHRATILVSPAASGTSQTELTPSNPAAGAGFTYTNNTGAPQTLTSAKFTFTADAVVANRFVSVQIKDGSGNVVAENADLTAVVASTSLSMFLAAGLANIPNGASGTVLGGLPAVVLQPGWQVVINVSGIDAGDQVSAIVMTFSQAAGAAAPFIYLGSQAQCLTGTAGRLYAGQSVVIENNQQLFMAPDGADPVTVSVLAERWDSGTGQ